MKLRFARLFLVPLSLVIGGQAMAQPSGEQAASDISCLSFLFRTGVDDFRDDSTLTVQIKAVIPGARGRTITKTYDGILNQRTRWPDHSLNTRNFCFPSDESVWLSDLERATLRFYSGGNDWNADNWNMDRVRVRAIYRDNAISPYEMYDVAGSPLHRFKKNSAQSKVLTFSTFGS